MMDARRIAGPLAAFALACAFMRPVSAQVTGRADAGSSGATRAAPALHVLPDPGPAPPLLPSDYAGYRRGSGSATLIGHVPSLGLGDAQQSCRGASVVLYPNTAYTRWMIETWARMLDGNALSGTLLFPERSGTRIAVPKYLSLDDDGPDSDLQLGYCDEYNDVTFRNVPAGKYIFVAETSSLILGRGHEREGVAIAETPYGAAPVAIDEGYESSGHPGDGYVVATRASLDVENGRSYTIAPPNMILIAHFLPFTP